jgi:hypothetical protein
MYNGRAGVAGRTIVLCCSMAPQERKLQAVPHASEYDVMMVPCDDAHPRSEVFLCGALVSGELLACGMLPPAYTAFTSSPFHMQPCTDWLNASRQCIKSASYNVTSNQAARLEARIKAACGELDGDSAWVRCDGLFNKEFLRGMSGCSTSLELRFHQ